MLLNALYFSLPPCGGGPGWGDDTRSASSALDIGGPSPSRKRGPVVPSFRRSARKPLLPFEEMCAYGSPCGRGPGWGVKPGAAGRPLAPGGHLRDSYTTDIAQIDTMSLISPRKMCAHG